MARAGVAEINPAGLQCNLVCTHCYQNPMRDTGEFGGDGYDLDAIKDAVGRREVSLFGGEALLAPMAKLEELLAWGFQQLGYTSIQTNATLMSDAHIEMFRRYRTGVGISIDGPGELNDMRSAGTIEETREATAIVEANIARLCEAGIALSLIITLYRGNTGPALPRLKEWIRNLVKMGVKEMRLHILEVDNPLTRRMYSLTDEENIAAFIDLIRFDKELGGVFDVAKDMRRLLGGRDDDVTCIWGGCDPYNTRAVYSVGPDGDVHNCGRTNKDGVNWQQSDTYGRERYLALYHTPQEHGGCNGCRFFLMCRGQCPGTAIDGDWRNRTEHCRIWKGLYTYLELEMLGDGLAPLSLSPGLPALEREFLGQLASGQRGSTSGLLGIGGGHGDSHGDHVDAGQGEGR